MNYMTESQILELKELAKAGDVWWLDGDGGARHVEGVILQWKEPHEDDELREPVAALGHGQVVALYLETPDRFVKMAPALISRVPA